MKKLRISVVIPFYNAETTIDKCLKALKGQTTKPLEIILVDDGSTDDSLAIISRFKKSNIKVLEQNHQGPSRARNLGAKKAKGEILAFTDSDCIPSKNWLKKIVASFADSKVGAVGGGYSEGIDKSFWQRFSHQELFFRRKDFGRQVATLVTNNMACRKSIFTSLGGFDRQYPVCEDMLLSFQISRNHKVIWLKGNGVKHHFKKSLIGFLKHQYFFGKQSTYFFLKNSNVALNGNHQGKSLHLSIATSFFATIALLWLQPIFILFFFLHLLLYLSLLRFLNNKNFSNQEIAKAYFVSFARDLVCSIAFFEGFWIFLLDKSRQNE